MSLAVFIRFCAGVLFALSAFGYLIFKGDSAFGWQLAAGVYAASEGLAVIITRGFGALGQLGKVPS